MSTMNSKHHHFTNAEKREFLRIVKKYAQLIENKSCDRNTSRRKTIAWNRIACEYNTSSLSPYPASSKQLRRLWMNLKQRNKLSINKFDQDLENSESSFTNEDILDARDDSVEELSTPFYVNVGDSSSQVDALKIEENTERNETFIATGTDGAGRAFSVELIEDVEEDVKPKQSNGNNPDNENGVNRVKNNLLVREYQDKRRRLDELNQLQKRLLLEQIREARAKANLAELELRQRQYLEP